MDKEEKIYIAGHSGLIGSAVLNKLKKEGYSHLTVMTHRELDLARQAEVEKFFAIQKPQYVILAAARVGGIKANMTNPAQFIYENIVIQSNIIHSANLYGVKKLLFFASACTYPRECSQPMKEEYLLSGYLEPTNEAYAVAKIAGIAMCQAYNRQYGTNFISAIFTNVYGPHDNFDPENAHVIPALIKKFHKAKTDKSQSVIIWGTGNSRREFLYVDDAAEAAFFLLNNYDSSEIINVGVGYDLTIKKLAYMVKEIVGFKGKIIFDTTKPDGIPRKMLDISRIKALGWQAKTDLRDGITKTYDWFKRNAKRVNL